MNVLLTMEDATKTVSTFLGHTRAGVIQGIAWLVTDSLVMVSYFSFPLFHNISF